HRLVVLSGLALVLFAAPLSADSPNNSTEIWQAWSADAELHIYPQSLAPIGVEVYSGSRRVADGNTLQFADRGLGTLEFHAPFGNFEAFLDGRLVLSADLEFRRGSSSVRVSQLLVGPDPTDPLRLLISDGRGRVLFNASHVHVYTVPDRQRLVMERMDVRMAPDLARALGVEQWSDRFVGELALDAQLHIPPGAKTAVSGGSCAERPNWPTDGHRLDVSLINMGFLADRGSLIENGLDFEIITPSATLMNDPDLGAADAAWFRKFTGDFPPYDTDQHPYLVWNLYRIHAGRLEQVGVSGVKHAFFTVNSNCLINCGDGGISGASGHILWPGCEDVYGIGNNDSPGDLGPRGEVNPRTGVFVSTGSFFDQDADGVQENGSNGTGENRLKVLREDLQTADAEYFFESWYVIRDDVNIFNSMGHHPVTPTGNGENWSYPLGPFATGAAVDQWVPAGGLPEAGAMNVAHQSEAVGHFKVLARADELAENRWRYTYVVMNYDVDHGIESLSIASNASADSFYFHDPDQDAGNDWSASVGPGRIAFENSSDNPIDWGTGYSFGFESPDGPAAGDVLVQFGPTGPADGVTLSLLAPWFTEDIFADDFESDL
ncbi:MAG: hypothetical protein RQ741_04960, partial [Wenzhouxiangellaceae bacterium]|nr:hypothetical protein [Wenzhouxiangellaceae bacterium]